MSREQQARILGALSASLSLGKGIAGLRGVCGSSLGSAGHVYAVEREGMPVPLVCGVKITLWWAYPAGLWNSIVVQCWDRLLSLLALS